MIMKTSRKFELGQVVATPGCLELLNRLNQSPIQLLSRHTSGDWGDCCKEDAEANERALKDGSRIFSVYRLEGGTVWIITEATHPDDGKRRSTCLLLPSES